MTLTITQRNLHTISLPNKIKICGPDLPSSGTVCIAQVLKILDHLKKEQIGINLTVILNVLDYIYFLREKFLVIKIL